MNDGFFIDASIKLHSYFRTLLYILIYLVKEQLAFIHHLRSIVVLHKNITNIHVKNTTEFSFLHGSNDS